MSSKMTSHQRIGRMFAHKEADRIPIIDCPWDATVERWHREGVDYFGLDIIKGITVDNSPRYEEKVLKETDEYKIYTTKWGATLKNWKHAASTPEFIDFE